MYPLCILNNTQQHQITIHFVTIHNTQQTKEGIYKEAGKNDDEEKSSFFYFCFVVVLA